MARYQVILAYDGTAYQGFQRQAGAETVQGDVEKALRNLGWRGRSILAAGRTDAGVHATGQVIAFDLDWKHSEDDLRAAINAHLPADVAAQRVVEAHGDFHPRYDAVSRSYRYHIFCQENRHPLREHFAWRVWQPVDLNRLALAARLLPGRHDFAAFGSPLRAGGSTLRTVFEAGWRSIQAQWETPDLVFEITADAFLFHMVRRLVAAQVLVGQAKLEVEELANLLRHPSETVVQGLAPPDGLVLVNVAFETTNNL
jgi:tRNA pseudouridine38-40 synthase